MPFMFWHYENGYLFGNEASFFSYQNQGVYGGKTIFDGNIRNIKCDSSIGFNLTNWTIVSGQSAPSDIKINNSKKNEHICKY